MCINTFVCRAVVAIRDIVDMNRDSYDFRSSGLDIVPAEATSRPSSRYIVVECARRVILCAAWKLTRPACRPSGLEEILQAPIGEHALDEILAEP